MAEFLGPRLSHLCAPPPRIAGQLRQHTLLLNTDTAANLLIYGYIASSWDESRNKQAIEK